MAQEWSVQCSPWPLVRCRVTIGRAQAAAAGRLQLPRTIRLHLEAASQRRWRRRAHWCRAWTVVVVQLLPLLERAPHL